MVISSRTEGGANVVSEAIRLGVPVLASRISGNIGLLGPDYPAYYAVGNGLELAKLMLRAASDGGFYATLKRRIARLRPMVTRLGSPPPYSSLRRGRRCGTAPTPRA